MFAKNAMKYPVLVMGLLMFGIFISQDSTHKWLNSYKNRFIPSTCATLTDRIKKTAPSDWKFECVDTKYLLINIPFSQTAKDLKNTRMIMYRALANHFTTLAKISNRPIQYEEKGETKVYNETETLERLKTIRIVLTGKFLEITSQSDGEAVAQFVHLTRPDQVAEHLRLTVRVSEKEL